MFPKQAPRVRSVCAARVPRTRCALARRASERASERVHLLAEKGSPVGGKSSPVGGKAFTCWRKKNQLLAGEGSSCCWSGSSAAASRSLARAHTLPRRARTHTLPRRARARVSALTQSPPFLEKGLAKLCCFVTTSCRQKLFGPTLRLILNPPAEDIKFPEKLTSRKIQKKRRKKRRRNACAQNAVITQRTDNIFQKRLKLKALPFSMHNFTRTSILQGLAMFY